MIRVLLVLAMLAATAGAVVAYGDPDQIARASNSVTKMLRQRSLEPAPAVQIARGKAGEFALHAKINGVKAPMVIDTGATSVVLTWETAKAIGLPIEMLEYNVDVETAGGHTKAARLTLDRLAVGGLVEKSVPALVVPRGQMKTNLLGMSFLDRLESWGVQADKLMLHGYPDVAGRTRTRSRSRDARVNQRDRIAQHVDAGARPDAVLGEMAAEGARAGHAVKRADEMPRHRMQPRALRELVFDIGHHRLEDVLHGRVRRRLAEQFRIDRRAAATAPDRPPAPASRRRHGRDAASPPQCCRCRH